MRVEVNSWELVLSHHVRSQDHSGDQTVATPLLAEPPRQSSTLGFRVKCHGIVPWRFSILLGLLIVLGATSFILTRPLASCICPVWKAALTWSIPYDLERLVVSAFSTDTEQTEWHMGLIWVAHTLWSDSSNKGCLQTWSPTIQQLFSRSVQREAGRLSCSSVLCGNPSEVDSTTSEGTPLTERAQTSRGKANTSFFHILHRGCHQEVWHRFKVGLPTSNDPIKKIPYGVPSSLDLN